MTSSFVVNTHDLEFILRQIKIAEAHAGEGGVGGISLRQAIMNEYGVSATDAALLPFGLRTVDGRFNNLLTANTEFGAADTPFPRLTDPVYNFENDEGGGFQLGPNFTVDNTNYGIRGNVVDSDPRTISNLIVDQTAANPAAILAALKANGIEGDAALAAQTAITSAYNATLTAGATANAAFTAAQTALNAASGAFGPAALADVAADKDVTYLTDAIPFATAARAEADETNTAMNALRNHLLTLNPNNPDPDPAVTQALFDAAVTAAQDAQTAASAVLDKLTGGDTARALQLKAASELLQTRLAEIAATDGAVNAADLAAVTTAESAYDNTIGAGGTAQGSVNDLNTRLTAAQILAAQTDAARLEAQAALDAAQTAYDIAVENNTGSTGTVAQAALNLANALADYEIEVGPEGGLFIRNISPDVGLTASFNSVMTIFGQFFDHGLDLVEKGSETVYIPLQPDDPLIAGADKVFGTADDLNPNLRFMALSRAVPFEGSQKNLTTPFVDQNQTYTSNASHQAFLREYDREGGVTFATGHLLDGSNGGVSGTPATWGETKAHALQMLGIRLVDTDVHNVPMLRVDPYGNLVFGPNGYAQLAMSGGGFVEGTEAGISTAGALRTGHPFLADIAHNAVPGTVFDTDGVPATPGTSVVEADGDSVAGNNIDVDFRGRKVAYDDELLDAHFITGDGRGNENIGLTGIHAVFHSEHNRLVEANKAAILETAADGDLSFLNEWLRGPDITSLPTNLNSLNWDGERLFQAARFATEMQYQHMVFEEFARRIQPFIDPFVFTNTAEIDPSILAEFAHAVYRFGHSMLTDTVDRLDNNLQVVGGPDGEQITLIDAFLDPVAYLDNGGTGATFEQIQAALIRGMSRDVGNEIDEFIVPALRSNLLGLPLDLAALNIARARETGVPSLNETRRQLFDDFGLSDLRPYVSWQDFTQNIKNPLSVINFIAAYGNHASITGATTLAQKRDAATLLVLGDGDNTDGVTIRGITYSNTERLDFLNGRGTFGVANDRGGLDNVDLWIGGLAEELNEFGGMLGTTFNFIFEYQLERLQNGDRLYYLSRTQGLNLLNQLEPNTFSDIVMRNSELGGDYATHLSAHLFLTPDLFLELDRGIAQEDYNLGDPNSRDPLWGDTTLDNINPKVVRLETRVVDGHTVGGELRFQGGEHVVLGGTEGDDILTSDRGDDTLWGDGGDDYLNGGEGPDEVFGGLGDDIIEDRFGDNFLRGNQGNDVVETSRGFNVVFGGEGKDAIFLGQDFSEVFGGEGDDFILGSSGPDVLMGNEGDDWMEGAESFDGMTGDNSELFFDSTIIGHDVLWAQGDDTDYDAESGDDVMLSGPGVQRFEGMFGFDWAIAKYDTSAAINIDLNRLPGLAVPGDILRDRYDHVEAASGWTRDDQIFGDDRGHVAGRTTPAPAPDPTLDAELLFVNDELTNANVSLIRGLDTWLGDGVLDVRNTLFGSATADFRDGNFLMGGGGSDTLAGRGGYDIIDGDAWLNVRIEIVQGGQTYTAESMNADRSVAGPLAGRVYTLGGDLAFGGRSLKALLLDRVINPGAMNIVREILSDSSGTDTARFSGNRADYEIEGSGTLQDGLIRNAFDVNGDGFISVRDLDNGTGIGGAAVRRDATGKIAVDDTDLIKNVEVFAFANQPNFQVNGTTTPPPPATATTALGFAAVAPAGNAVPGLSAVVGTLAGAAGSFALGAGSSAGLALAANGTITATAAFADNQTRTLNAVVTTTTETLSETFVIRTGSGAANTMTGTANDNVIFGRGGNDTITGLAGNDTLFGQDGGDTLNGGDGADSVQGGAGADILNGGAAGDNLQGGAGADFLAGDAGADTLNGGAAADTFVGGEGADQIDTGAADDNLVDRIRYSDATEYGDAATNFDATGANADRVEFGGGLNAALDDGAADDNFLFVSGTALGATTTALVGQANANAEALMLINGVTTANLGNAAGVGGVVSAFNTEFVITAANGEDALLVADASNGNSFSVWHWVQAGGGEVSAAELTLVGIFAANATVTTTSFDFF